MVVSAPLPEHEPLVAAALRRADELPGGAVGPSPGPPAVDGGFVLSRPLSLAAGTTLTGGGLLILRNRLDITCPRHPRRSPTKPFAERKSF